MHAKTVRDTSIHFMLILISFGLAYPLVVLDLIKAWSCLTQTNLLTVSLLWSCISKAKQRIAGSRPRGKKYKKSVAGMMGAE